MKMGEDGDWYLMGVIMKIEVILWGRGVLVRGGEWGFLGKGGKLGGYMGGWGWEFVGRGGEGWL